MCWCTPEIRTPCCGKPDCHPPTTPTPSSENLNEPNDINRSTPQGDAAIALEYFEMAQSQDGGIVPEKSAAIIRHALTRARELEAEIERYRGALEAIKGVDSHGYCTPHLKPKDIAEQALQTKEQPHDRPHTDRD